MSSSQTGSLEPTGSADGASRRRPRGAGGFLLPGLASSPGTTPKLLKDRNRPDSRLSSSSHTDGALKTSAAGSDSAIWPAGAGQADTSSRDFDIDTKQIVDLALKLSESRRNAGRISSVSSATTVPAATDLVGRSLSQQIRQQRRTSRNMSPRSSRIDQHAVPKTPRTSDAFVVGSDGIPGYVMADVEDTEPYQFSASTLARARKAKDAIELMAQYRRLLEQIPPLPTAAMEPVKRAKLDREDMGHRYNTSSSSAGDDRRALGRPYNPLQYIRNRIVRARERASFDGAAEGYGNLDAVKQWVDNVGVRAARGELQSAGAVSLPPISTREVTDLDDTSIATTRTTRRPRIGWTINPADLLADIAWLERDDHIFLIEDRNGRKLLSNRQRYARPDREDDAIPTRPAGPLKVTTYLPHLDAPEDSDSLNSAGSRARRKFRDLTLRHPEHRHTDGHRHGFGLRRGHSRSNSESDSSQSSLARARIGSHQQRDAASNILEKQMLNLIKAESRETDASEPQDREAQRLVESIESTKPALRAELERKRGLSVSMGSRPSKPLQHSRTSSYVRSDESQRQSLDVPQSYGRLLSPDSPIANETSTFKTHNNDKRSPGVASDVYVTPGQSRAASPAPPKQRPRGSSLRVNDRDGSDKAGLGNGSAKNLTLGALSAYERRSRSLSPPKRTGTQASEAKAAKARGPRRSDGASGIKGLLRTGRHNVSKLGGLIWRRDSIGQSTRSDGSCSDASDIEDYRDSRSNNISHQTTRSQTTETPRGERISLELPTFTPLPERGRRNSRTHQTAEAPDPLPTQPTTVSGAEMLKPPQIQIRGSSPASSAASSVSNLSRPRRRVGQFDAMLGAPGHVHHATAGSMPMTGLAAFDALRDGNEAWVSSAKSARRDLARLHALLTTSGVKAAELCRRINTTHDLAEPEATMAPGALAPPTELYRSIAALRRPAPTTPQVTPGPMRDSHLLAARLLSADMQLSSRLWQTSVDVFATQTLAARLERLGTLRRRILGTETDGAAATSKAASTARDPTTQGLSDRTKLAADEADALSRAILGPQTLAASMLTERINALSRRRRRRFRWLRRAGWAGLEWVLIGAMWLVWGIVVVVQALAGTARGLGRVGGWLLGMDG